jgi:crotonobetaine/carnitine-CoA ligase
MLPNSRIGIELFFGIMGRGAIEVPIHNEYRGSFLAHVLNTAPARVIVIPEASVQRLAEVADQVPELRTVIVVEGDRPLPDLPFRVHDAAELLAGAGPIPPTDDTQPRDVCMVMFTSGTTGVSKGVLVSYTQFRASTEGAWPHTFFGPGDVNYLILPLYHISGKVAVDSMLLAGGRVAIRERFKTGEFWSDVRATGATCACMMGAMAGFLMAEPKTDADADNPLDKILMLPLPPYLDEFRERFGVRVHTIYNQTEISCPIVSDGFTTGHYTSCGRLRNGYEVRIVDADDGEVPSGEVGELIVRAQEPWTMMSGYVGMPDKTVEAWRNQWIHTGDAFKVDGEGNYYFVDRFKDVIRRRGENISSVEVEAAVCEHPDVIECAAIPIASEWSEEEVKVVVVRREASELSAPQLVDYLAERIPRFMVPRYVEFAGELPKTPTQKVRKSELRELGVTDATWDRETTGVDART